MSKLEQRLEALASQKGLQEAGVVRLYLAEWDLVPCPPKFKAPTLQGFDDKASPNQHIYYFKSLTGNVVSNDAILTRLFISTLKRIAFEWFMKLPEGSIENWGDMENFSLHASSKMTQKLPCQLSWRRGNEKESQLKHLWRDFRIWHSDVLTV